MSPAEEQSLELKSVIRLSVLRCERKCAVEILQLVGAVFTVVMNGAGFGVSIVNLLNVLG